MAPFFSDGHLLQYLSLWRGHPKSLKPQLLFYTLHICWHLILPLQYNFESPFQGRSNCKRLRDPPKFLITMNKIRLPCLDIFGSCYCYKSSTRWNAIADIFLLATFRSYTQRKNLARVWQFWRKEHTLNLLWKKRDPNGSNGIHAKSLKVAIVVAVTCALYFCLSSLQVMEGDLPNTWHFSLLGKPLIHSRRPRNKDQRWLCRLVSNIFDIHLQMVHIYNAYI